MVDFNMQLIERTKNWASLFLDWAMGGWSERLKQKTEIQGRNVEKAKKMKKNREGNYGDISTILGDDLLCEILSRFPVKSLMLFKCVCKRWKSLIQDPYFVSLHFNRSEPRCGLLIHMKMEHGTSLFSADLFEGCNAVLRKKNSWNYPMLNSVNGLVCFVLMEGSVKIYNPSTQEMTPWIETTTKKEEEEENGVREVHQKCQYCPWYGFGFDPVTKVHKVICIWIIRRFQTFPEPLLIAVDQVCEVLTVGENSWRRINEVPAYVVVGASVHVNGVIYWRNTRQDKRIPEPEVIVAFNVGSEKFRVIPIPTFILDYQKFSGMLLPFVEIMEMDGHIALLGRLSGCTVRIWIYNEDMKKSPTSASWIEETILMSFDWQQERHQCFIPIAGTDQILIKPLKPIDHFSLYYYDRKEKTFNKVKITGISSFTNLGIGGVSKDKSKAHQIIPFVESLLPVQGSNSQQPPPGHFVFLPVSRNNTSGLVYLG